MIMMMKSIFILLFITRQSFQIEDTRNNKPSLSILQYKDEYLQCNMNSIYQNRNWFPQMKVLDESQDNMTTVRGRFVKVHKTGRLIVLCYIKTDDTENDAFVWITKLYQITKSSKKLQHYIRASKSSLEVNEIRPATESEFDVIPFDPQINTTIIQRRVSITVSCSHIYSINERRDLQLLRILSNGRKLSIKLNAMKLSASFVDENLTVMKYNHDFVYNHRDYFDNSFECRSVDKFYKDFKSSISNSIKLNRKCGGGNNLKIDAVRKFTMTDRAKDYLINRYDVLECSCEGSYPPPNIKWIGSSGILIEGKYLSMNQSSLETYCCVITQSLAQSHHEVSACVTTRKTANVNHVTQPAPSLQTDRQSNYNDYRQDSNDGDAWIVIQRRFGPLSFNRTWTEYKNGFGDPNGEFWLGNDRLHELTSAAPMKIRFDLWDVDNNHVYAEYSSFSVASESDNYRLSIDRYSGTAGDSMKYHNNMPFSTYDRDNDLYTADCSRVHGGYGGWWFKDCYFANLNGYYDPHGTSLNGNIDWKSWAERNGRKSPSKVTIKIAYK